MYNHPIPKKQRAIPGASFEDLGTIWGVLATFIWVTLNPRVLSDYLSRFVNNIQAWKWTLYHIVQTLGLRCREPQLRSTLWTDDLTHPHWAGSGKDQDPKEGDYSYSSWCLNQLHWKICWSNWIISPGRGENTKYLKPPPSYCFENDWAHKDSSKQMDEKDSIFYYDTHATFFIGFCPEWQFLPWKLRMIVVSLN